VLKQTRFRNDIYFSRDINLWRPLYTICPAARFLTITSTKNISIIYKKLCLKEKDESIKILPAYTTRIQDRKDVVPIQRFKEAYTVPKVCGFSVIWYGV